MNQKPASIPVKPTEQPAIQIDSLAYPLESRNPQNFKNLQELRNKCVLLRQKVCNFLTKLDTNPDSLDYNSCLNNLNLIYSEINGVLRFVDSERYQELIYRHTIMPISVLNENDEKLKQTTENRIPFFNHEVIPNVLRTKQDLDIENKDNQIANQAIRKFGSINSQNGQLDVKKLNNLDDSINLLQKMVTRAIEKIEKSNKSSQSSNSDLNSKHHRLGYSKDEHTYQLLNIYRFGKGLVSSNNQNVSGVIGSGNQSDGTGLGINNSTSMGSTTENKNEAKKESKGKKGGNKRKNVTTTLSVNQ